MARLMERVIEDQPVDVLTTKDLIEEARHDFLGRRFCISCHFAFFNLILINVDKKRPIN